jgi:hypothetical protein
VEVESDASDEVVGCFWNALNWASRVTERPNVAQNHVAVTTVTPQKIPRKILSTPEPAIQALSSRFSVFLECLSRKLAA